jgi:hypothetical protein
VGIHCADHETPSIRKKLALTLPTRGGHSVGIVCLRPKATEFIFLTVSETSAIYMSHAGMFFRHLWIKIKIMNRLILFSFTEFFPHRNVIK